MDKIKNNLNEIKSTMSAGFNSTVALCDLYEGDMKAKIKKLMKWQQKKK